jgi:hypothetical protein
VVGLEPVSYSEVLEVEARGLKCVWDEVMKGSSNQPRADVPENPVTIGTNDSTFSTRLEGKEGLRGEKFEINFVG